MDYITFKQQLNTLHQHRITLLTEGKIEEVKDTFSPCELSLIARKNHSDWGFRCASDVIEDAMPKSDTLTLKAISSEVITHKGYTFSVTAKPFDMAFMMHVEIRNKGNNPLPITSTGYKSLFEHMEHFAQSSLYDYIEFLFEKYPAYEPEPQMELF